MSARPAGNRPGAQPTVTRTDCRAEGWRCTYDARCDRHQVDVDPDTIGDVLRGLFQTGGAR